MWLHDASESPCSSDPESPALMPCLRARPWNPGILPQQRKGKPTATGRSSNHECPGLLLSILRKVHVVAIFGIFSIICLASQARSCLGFLGIARLLLERGGRSGAGKNGGTGLGGRLCHGHRRPETAEGRGRGEAVALQGKAQSPGSISWTNGKSP